MTASSAFLGLSKMIVRETMCCFFLQKRVLYSPMAAPSAFWIQIYEDISKLWASSKFLLLPQNLDCFYQKPESNHL